MTQKKGAAKPRNAYDPALDVIVHTFYKAKLGATNGVRLVLRRYNGGEVKLAYEKVWQDKSGETRSKVERCPTRVLVAAGILTPEIEKAATVEAARKSEPATAPPTEAAFEL